MPLYPELRRSVVLLATHVAARAEGQSIERAFGISSEGVCTLVAIGQYGPLANSDLGQMLLLPASSVNYRLKSLEAGGLVEMAEDPEDKRKMLIRLTSKGRDLLDRIDAEETQKERLRRSKYVRPAMRLERCFAILGTAD